MGTMCQSLEPKGVVGSNQPTPVSASVISSAVELRAVPSQLKSCVHVTIVVLLKKAEKSETTSVNR